MKKPDIFNVLTYGGWLAEIDPQLARAVIDAGRLLQFGRGDTLYHPGDDPGGMYGVVEGGVMISAVGRDGAPVAGHIHRRGGWFGYGSVLEKQNRALIAAATEATRVLHLPLGEIDRLRGRFPTSAAAFARLAVRTEMIYVAALTDLLMSPTDRRLASVLMRVAGVDGPLCDRPLRIDPRGEPWAGPPGVSLTQAMLGELANASPHTVARFVERMVRTGWITWSYGRVCIQDPQAIAQFVRGV